MGRSCSALRPSPPVTEVLASACPDHFSTFYQTLRSDEEPSDARNKAMEEIVDAANKAWSQANETLFHHVLDYEGKVERIPKQSWRLDP